MRGRVRHACARGGRCRCASRTTRSSATARPPRSSAKTGRSTGYACRASIRARASPPCSAARSTDAGSWRPACPSSASPASYRDGSLILDTTFETDDAEVTVTDCMPMRDAVPHVIRIVRGVRGRMAMRTELVVRFDYGSIVPWVRKGKGGGIRAIAGPDSIRLQSDVPLRGENLTTVAEFDVARGDVGVARAHVAPVARQGAPRGRRGRRRRAHRARLARVVGPEHVRGPVAATSSTARSSRSRRSRTRRRAASSPRRRRRCPKAIGGVRNWDYRYCWVRDATFTLLALMHNGFMQEARRLARVAPSRRGRGPVEAADHVRRRRRAAPRRGGDPLAARLRRRRRPSASATRRSSSASSTSTAR